MAAPRLPLKAEMARAMSPNARPSRTSITSAAASGPGGSGLALMAAPAIAKTHKTTTHTMQASTTASHFSRTTRRRDTG